MSGGGQYVLYDPKKPMRLVRLVWLLWSQRVAGPVLSGCKHLIICHFGFCRFDIGCPFALRFYLELSATRQSEGKNTIRVRIGYAGISGEIASQKVTSQKVTSKKVASKKVISANGTVNAKGVKT